MRSVRVYGRGISCPGGGSELRLVGKSITLEVFSPVKLGKEIGSVEDYTQDMHIC